MLCNYGWRKKKLHVIGKLFIRTIHCFHYYTLFLIPINIFKLFKFLHTRIFIPREDFSSYLTHSVDRLKWSGPKASLINDVHGVNMYYYTTGHRGGHLDTQN